MNHGPIQIRPARLEDLDSVVAFNRAMALESEKKNLDLPTLTAGVRSALSDTTRSAYYVAEVDGVIAGQTMVTTEWSDWRNAFFWWIQSVYVDPAHRRRGVFRALYDHIRIAARRRRDVCGLRLYVHKENLRAIETYRRQGMIQTDYVLCEEDWSPDTA